MTGYGKAEAILEAGKITVEVRSLNGKTADISLKTSMLPKDKIYHLYTPKIEGKEARKEHRSKAGVLGVEGVDSEIILKLLAPFSCGSAMRKNEKMITKVDFYNDKLTGFPNSKERRAALAKALDLPPDMTANALLEAINLLFGYDEYRLTIDKLDGDVDATGDE